MDTRVSLYLAGFLVLAGSADMALTGGQTLLFLARKFVDLMDWVEFWR